MASSSGERSCGAGGMKERRFGMSTLPEGTPPIANAAPVRALHDLMAELVAMVEEAMAARTSVDAGVQVKPRCGPFGWAYAVRRYVEERAPRERNSGACGVATAGDESARETYLKKRMRSSWANDVKRPRRVGTAAMAKDLATEADCVVEESGHYLELVRKWIYLATGARTGKQLQTIAFYSHAIMTFKLLAEALGEARFAALVKRKGNAKRALGAARLSGSNRIVSVLALTAKLTKHGAAGPPMLRCAFTIASVNEVGSVFAPQIDEEDLPDTTEWMQTLPYCMEEGRLPVSHEMPSGQPAADQPAADQPADQPTALAPACLHITSPAPGWQAHCPPAELAAPAADLPAEPTAEPTTAAAVAVQPAAAPAAEPASAASMLAHPSDGGGLGGGRGGSGGEIGRGGGSAGGLGGWIVSPRRSLLQAPDRAQPWDPPETLLLHVCPAQASNRGTASASGAQPWDRRTASASGAQPWDRLCIRRPTVGPPLHQAPNRGTASGAQTWDRLLLMQGAQPWDRLSIRRPTAPNRGTACSLCRVTPAPLAPNRETACCFAAHTAAAAPPWPPPTAPAQLGRVAPALAFALLLLAVDAADTSSPPSWLASLFGRAALEPTRNPADPLLGKCSANPLLGSTVTDEMWARSEASSAAYMAQHTLQLSRTLQDNLAASIDLGPHKPRRGKKPGSPGRGSLQNQSAESLQPVFQKRFDLFDFAGECPTTLLAHAQVMYF
ncbi:hypothetical protein T492DRAFT_888052 [Pavlovales sp. CCMP2436]|nr:hypothetical protein T492DRAFT_888052 [Pavlovales sp. CCMP2436]